VSYTVPAPTPEPRERPATVSLAVWLLYFTALVWLASGVVSILVTSDMTKVYERALADEPNIGSEGASGFSLLITGISVGLALVLGVGLIVLGVLNSRGNNVGRIITWVIAGLGICCSGYGLISTAASSGLGMSGGSGMNAEELRRAMDELLPSWYMPVSIATAVLEIVALIGVVVLLALPPSHRYFRRAEPPPWEPPVPSYPPVDLPPR
jgi:hypothetical protein